MALQFIAKSQTISDWMIAVIISVLLPSDIVSLDLRLEFQALHDCSCFDEIFIENR